MTFSEAMEHVAQFFEAIGALVLVVGLLFCFILAIRAYRRSGDGRRAYQVLRESFGGVILLGIEILVAADLVRTVAGRHDTGERRDSGSHRPDSDGSQFLAGGRDRRSGTLASGDGQRSGSGQADSGEKQRGSGEMQRRVLGPSKPEAAAVRRGLMPSGMKCPDAVMPSETHAVVPQAQTPETPSPAALTAQRARRNVDQRDASKCHSVGVRWVMRMSDSTKLASRTGDRYLLLADISGYTAFMASVESDHGVDFSGGIPAGFAIVGRLLDGVIEGVQPDFEVIKLEGDAVFAVAPAASLDGRGGDVLDRLQALYETFRTRRELAARTARDHVCTACPVVSNLDLKMVLHRGQAIRQTVGSQTELLGPAVNVVHRLLKNSIQAHLGYRPYAFLTDAAAAWLHLAELGVEHREDYPDVGPVSGRVLPLGESPGQSIPGAADAPDRLSEGLSMGRSDGFAN